MDNIIELIFTLVVGFFWLFGGTLFNKKQDEQQEPFQPSTRSRKNRRGSEPDSREEERQREIRESIRRKIEERRRQSEPGPVIAFEPEPQEELVAVEAVEEPAEAAFSWNSEESTYEQEMRERLQEIEATKRKAEALRNKVGQIMPDNGYTDSSRDSEEAVALSLGSIKATFKNSRSLRAAFVCSEVLGRPVALRGQSANTLGSF